jgi:hypothetical protein
VTIQPGEMDQGPQPFNLGVQAPGNLASNYAKRVINANVAEVNPALYAAGARTNLTREERNLIENWSSIKGTHEKLMNMDNKRAAESFKKLHPDYQVALKEYYNIDYENKPQSNMLVEDPLKRKLLGLDNGLSVGDIFKSPFRFLFHAAEQYTKVINTPFSMAQNATINRESFWTRSNFEASFDGDFNYDESVATPLVQKHGKALSFAAMHILAGKTPGEVIDAWGPNDAEILSAVNILFNKPNEFADVMDEFDRARLSPGRNVARWVNKTFDISAEEHPDWFKNGSGLIDGAFQIFADPLTYLTGGLINIGKAEKLTRALKSSRDVVEHFARPEVARYFTGYSEEIGKYSKAVESGDSIAAGKIVETIRTKFPEHGTDKEISLWSQSGVVDFDTFKLQFTGENPENFGHLIHGKVVGTAFSRESAAFARPTREFTLGAKQKVKEFFTGKVNWDDVDKTSADILLKEMQDAGLDRSGNYDFTQIDDILRQKTGNMFQRFIQKQTSLHPGNKVVFFDDEKVLETVEVLRNQAYLALEDKKLAHMFVEHFKSSTEQQRIALKRTVDELTLRKTGIYGMPGGKEYATKLLDGHYGGVGKFSVAETLKKPAAWNSGDETVEILGPIQAHQFKDGISSMDWRAISEFAAKHSKKDTSLTVENASNIIGGAYNSKVVGDLIDAWSLLTLIPQLGIRTAVDEGFFFAMTTKLGIAREYRRAKKVGRVFSAYTGDLAVTGPIKNILQVTASKLTGRQFGASRSITQDERDVIFGEAFEGLKKGTYATKYEAEIAARKELFDLALAKHGKGLPPEMREYLYDAALYNPNVLAQVSASNITDALISRNALRGDAHVISSSANDISLKEAGAVPTGDYKSFNPRDLTLDHLNVIMFDNFISAFSSKGFNFGGKYVQEADPARLFLANNSLRTEQDLINATDQFLKGIGFEFNGKIWQVNNKKVGDVQRFLNSTTHMAKYDGLSDVEKARGFITDVYTDLYSRFHGDHTKFNDELNDVFKTFQNGNVADHRYIVDKLKLKDDVLHPSGLVQYKSYGSMVNGFTPEERIFSDLDFHLSDDYASYARKFRDKAFEMMSRQSDAIYRQPAVHSHYLVYRAESKVDELAYMEKIKKDQIRQGIDPKKAEQNASEISRRFFTDRAMTRAANQVLKYADNPEMRTVFAYNVRTVGRFYRAVEDFHRRMYRLVKDNKLSTIYRLRLISQGLNAVGDVHEDANGEQFVILPMDDVIYSAVDGALNLITNGEIKVSQPLFNDITFNVMAGNPSFQSDAGMPYLSGPAGSLSVWGVKALLGKFDPTKNFAEDIDQVALGSMGDNVTLRSAITPKFVNNIWKMLSPDERSQQEVSAYTQALSYNQANGLGIDPQDYYNKETGVIDQAGLDEAKRKYLADVKVSAHNIIVTRSLLGMILPFAVQTKDTKDLPTYLKDNGVVNLKSSFYEVHDQIKMKYPDVEDPWELSLATWTGENPGKVVYLVSTNQEGVKPMLKFSSEMQNWAIKNKDAIDKYGAGALMFAPYTGEFSPGVYQWAEAAGIVNKVPENASVYDYISKYYEDVMLKEYANAYYDINDQEQADLINVSFSNPDLRRASTSAYSRKRKILLLQTPGLEDYIKSGADNSDATDFIQSTYNYVNSVEASVNPKTKELINEAYNVYNEFIDYANRINMLEFSEGAEMKRAQKAKAIKKIEELIKSDPTKTVEQYYRYGLLKLMNSKSRDADVTINRNVVK